MPTAYTPDLAGIAQMMGNAAAGTSPFLAEVSTLLACIADDHGHPRQCPTCDLLGAPCLAYEQAQVVAITWLMAHVRA